MMERLLTIQEAAGIMRVHRNTISRWIAQGRLIAIGTEQTKRIPIENLLNMRKAG
jgi:excisionase family DNA binding protein